MKMIRAFLVMAAALALCGTAQAQAQGRIGVTQATENSPLGKPPTGPDRILRVGTDIQANEVVTTSATDRAHLVFLDGTTVTIGPNSRLIIDKFVYDPSTQKGEIALNASTGVFRIIGGRISKTSEVKVATPSASLGIRGGIMVFNVTVNATTSMMVYGDQMSVTSLVNGVSQTTTVNVPGLGVATSLGAAPGTASVTVAGDLTAALSTLVTDTKAAAAVVTAVQTLVANNVGNPVTLAAVLAAIIQAVVPNAILAQNTTVTVTTTENVNQSAASPN